MKVQWKDGQFARGNAQWQKGGWHDYGIAKDWQDSSARLFDLAGQVARTTAGAQEPLRAP